MDYTKGIVERLRGLEYLLETRPEWRGRLSLMQIVTPSRDAVEWLLDQYPIERDLPIAFGDDHKDESVFAVVQERGGFAIGVGQRYPLPGVNLRLQSPDDAREWLQSLLVTP